MKKSLGSLLLLCLSLFANSDLATYTLSANKSSAYVKEAISITFSAQQTDHTDVMFFFLEPKKSADYKILLLNKKTDKISYHNYKTTFTYLLFPLKDKTIKIGFDFTIKTASDKAVAQVFEGSRDNTKWIETTDTDVPLPELTLTVKPLKHKVDLVGDFAIDAKLAKSKIAQYDTANIVYKLNGQGYNENNFSVLPKIKGVTVFSEVTDAYSKTTKDGYIIQRAYNYALVADHSFDIPAVNIAVYSPKRDLYYTLTTPAQHISVSKLDPTTLIDDTEYPQEEVIDLSFYRDLLIVLAVFGIGFITGRMSTALRLNTKERPYSEIEKAKDAQTLLLILLKYYHHEQVSHFIDELESLEQHANGRQFKKIKKRIIASTPKRSVKAEV